MAKSTAPAPVLQDRFTDLERSLNSLMIERPHEIRAAMLALVSRSHLLLIGPPGTGKSRMIDLLSKLITDVRTFQILMTRFTTPNQVFGPVSLRALEEDKLEHNIDGYLPWADIAFVDEIFKAGPSILNTLLWQMEERKYRHGNEIIATPLSSLLCASNELPTASDELGALYDRVHMRVQVEPIKDNRNLRRMLTLNDEDLQPVMSWDDVTEAQIEAKAVTHSDDALDSLVKLRGALSAAGFAPSDRRVRKVLGLMQASAWLDGRTETDSEDLLVCQHVFWDRPEQIAEVDRIVTAHASPLAAKCGVILADIDRFEADLGAISQDEKKVQKAEEIYNKLIRCKKEIEVLAGQTGSVPSRQNQVERVRDRLKSVTTRVLKEVYGIDPETAENGGN